MAFKSAAAVVLSLCLAVPFAYAQTRPARADVRMSGGTLSQSAPGDALRSSDERSRADADARDCLDFLTNIGVIRCAEKYRANRRPPAR